MEEEYFLTFGVVELPDNSIPVIASKKNAIATVVINYQINLVSKTLDVSYILKDMETLLK